MIKWIKKWLFRSQLKRAVTYLDCCWCKNAHRTWEHYENTGDERFLDLLCSEVATILRDFVPGSWSVSLTTFHRATGLSLVDCVTRKLVTAPVVVEDDVTVMQKGFIVHFKHPSSTEYISFELRFD